MYSETDTLAPERPAPEKLLSEIAENSRAQLENSRKQLFYTRLCAIALAAILLVSLISAVLVVPKAVRALDELHTVAGRLEALDIEALLDDIDRLLETLKPVAERLDPLMGDLGDTVLAAQRDMEEALKAIESIDIETLNKAIADLSAIVEPLARLFGR